LHLGILIGKQRQPKNKPAKTQKRQEFKYHAAIAIKFKKYCGSCKKQEK
jgi:hypothetical protein